MSVIYKQIPYAGDQIKRSKASSGSERLRDQAYNTTNELQTLIIMKLCSDMAVHENFRHCSIETLELGTVIRTHRNKQIYHTMLKRKLHIHISETHTHTQVHARAVTVSHDRRSLKVLVANNAIGAVVENRGILLAVCHSRRDAIGMCAVRYTCVRPPESVCDMCSTNCSPVCGKNCQLNGAMNILRKCGNTWT